MLLTHRFHRRHFHHPMMLCPFLTRSLIMCQSRQVLSSMICKGLDAASRVIHIPPPLSPHTLHHPETDSTHRSTLRFLFRSSCAKLWSKREHVPFISSPTWDLYDTSANTQPHTIGLRSFIAVVVVVGSVNVD